MEAAQDKNDGKMTASCGETSSKATNVTLNNQDEVKGNDLLEIKEKLATLIRDHAQDILKSDQFRSEFQVRVQPLFQRIRILEDENRRLKITLEFFKNELKSTKCKNEQKKSTTKDQEVQVDEIHFFAGEKEPGDKHKSHPISTPLKRTFDATLFGHTNGTSGPVEHAKFYLQTVGKNQQQLVQPSKTFAMNKSTLNPEKSNGLVNTKRPQLMTLSQARQQRTVSNNSTTIPNVTKTSTVFFTSSSAPSPSRPILIPKNPFHKITPDIPIKDHSKTYSKTISQSSLTLSVVNPIPKNQIQQSSADSTSQIVSSSNSRDNKKINEDEDEIMELEPPKPKTPEVVDISDDDDEDSTSAQEIREERSECLKKHPTAAPTLPFAVTPSILPLPKLSVRHGVSRDGKRAIILRMESLLDTSKIEGALQYRIFKHLQNETEERRWKQLTVIKVQTGKICECTLTQLISGSRYHFVVCLVNGNNRSPFSNCASCVF
jgi:hypothetical protein